MDIYIIHTNFLSNNKRDQEVSVLGPYWAKTSYIEARRSIERFTKNWSISAKLARKVYPIHIVKQYKNDEIPLTISTFKGTRHSVGEVWFSISVLSFPEKV